MSDRDGTLNPLPESSLAAALRALPDAQPLPDLWPDLARRLARPAQRRWRFALPAAIAAALALALLLPRHPAPDPRAPSVASTQPAFAVTKPAATSAATPLGDDGELDGLHRRSQSLERWIAAVANDAPQNGRDLMAAVEVEDLIGLVDVQLGATRGDADALPLWRQRVALLEDLATIRGSAYAIAANDGGGARATPLSSPLMN